MNLQKTKNEFDYPADWYIDQSLEFKWLGLICIECKHRFEIPATENYDKINVFCFKCSNKRCLKCSIVLSYKYKCSNKMCHVKYHGKPSQEMPDFYCVDCVIYVRG